MNNVSINSLVDGRSAATSISPRNSGSILIFTVLCGFESKTLCPISWESDVCCSYFKDEDSASISLSLSISDSRSSLHVSDLTSSFNLFPDRRSLPGSCGWLRFKVIFRLGWGEGFFLFFPISFSMNRGDLLFGAPFALVCVYVGVKRQSDRVFG